MEDLFAEERDRGEEARARRRADRGVDEAQARVPQRRGEAERDERPGDLVRQESGVEVDEGERDERARQRRVSEGRPFETEPPVDRDHQQRSQQFDERIADA